jgi:hypothetical protein
MPRTPTRARGTLACGALGLSAVRSIFLLLCRWPPNSKRENVLRAWRSIFALRCCLLSGAAHNRSACARLAAPALRNSLVARRHRVLVDHSLDRSAHSRLQALQGVAEQVASFNPNCRHHPVLPSCVRGSLKVSCSQLFTLIAMRCFSLSTPGTTDQHPHSVPSLSFLDSLLTLQWQDLVGPFVDARELL